MAYTCMKYETSSKLLMKYYPVHIGYHNQLTPLRRYGSNLHANQYPSKPTQFYDIQTPASDSFP